MTEAHAIGPASPGGWLSRFTAFVFDGVAYVTFLFTILYAIGFVSGIVVPKAIDAGTESGVFEAIVVNLILISLFAVQYSRWARSSLKQREARFIPRLIERGTHALCASLLLLLLFWQWRPMPAIIWHIQDPEAAMLIATLSFLAWVIVVTSAFLRDQSEPVGLHQVANGRTGQPTLMAAPSGLRLLRQPINLGIIIALWAAPMMSAGHLLLAAAATAYILIGIMLEKRCRVSGFGSG